MMFSFYKIRLQAFVTIEILSLSLSCFFASFVITRKVSHGYDFFLLFSPKYFLLFWRSLDLVNLVLDKDMNVVILPIKCIDIRREMG